MIIGRRDLIILSSVISFQRGRLLGVTTEVPFFNPGLCFLVVANLINNRDFIPPINGLDQDFNNIQSTDFNIFIMIAVVPKIFQGMNSLIFGTTAGVPCLAEVHPIQDQVQEVQDLDLDRLEMIVLHTKCFILNSCIISDHLWSREAAILWSLTITEIKKDNKRLLQLRDQHLLQVRGQRLHLRGQRLHLHRGPQVKTNLSKNGIKVFEVLCQKLRDLQDLFRKI